MDQSQEKKQPILSHLAALRRIVIVSAVAVLVAFVVIFYAAADPLMHLIEQPIRDRGIEIISTGMSEALLTKLKVSLVAAIVAASPVIFWQIWAFIKPALYAHEKKAFRLTFAAIVALFLIGVVFCYFAVYMLAVDFFIMSGENLVTPMLSIQEYVDFMFGFVLPFGIAFELPVALYMTTKLGLTNYEMLASKRKYVILAIAIIAAILTPPDVVSQIMLGIPVLLLFEIGLQITRLVKPEKAKQESA